MKILHYCRRLRYIIPNKLEFAGLQFGMFVTNTQNDKSLHHVQKRLIEGLVYLLFSGFLQING